MCARWGLGAIASRVATVAQPYQQLAARTPPQGARRWMQILVVSQIASAVVVLVGAGLTLRSLDACFTLISALLATACWSDVCCRRGAIRVTRRGIVHSRER